MQRVLELINEKNQLLEKFYRTNEAEILNFAEGNFDHLEEFYDTREGILEMVNKVDEMIERQNKSEFSTEATPPAVQKQIIEALDYKNDLVTRVLSQDLQILSYVESAKSNIIRELTQVRNARKVVGSYSSGQRNHTLDEEA